MSDQIPVQPSSDIPPGPRTRGGIQAYLRNRWLKFTLGFIGFYVFNSILYLSVNLTVFAGLLILPLNLMVVATMALLRPTRWIGFGALGAIVLNFAVSLILGLVSSAVCMIPFYYGVK